jgi:enoyl-CoA hydratase
LRSVHENAFDADIARALQREGANGYRSIFDEGLDGASRFLSRASSPKGQAT